MLEEQNNKFKDAMDLIHTNIHALRMIPGYKPTEFERRIAMMISDFYKDKCADCKEAEMRMKYAPATPQQQGVLDKLFGGKQ